MSPMSGSRSTCTTPSSSSCSRPLRNCLKRPVSSGRAVANTSGENRGIGGNSTASLRTGVVQRVAELQAGGVDEADDVAGERLVDRLALGAEHRRRVLRGDVATGAVASVTLMPRSKLPAADAGERDPVAVRRVHVGLHLEHERRERAVERSRRRRRRRAAATAAGARSMTASSSMPHTEVGQRRADEHRRRLAGEERRQVDVGADRVEQRRTRRAPPVHAAPSSLLPAALAMSRSTISSGGDAMRRASVRVNAVNVAGAAVDRRRGTRSPSPTGHVAGVGRRSICFSISSSSSSGSRPGRSNLLRNVITGRLRDAAHLEQLQRLGLDALGRVEHHHHGVDGREHAVRVLARSRGGPGVSSRLMTWSRYGNCITVEVIEMPRCCSSSIQSLRRRAATLAGLAPHRPRCTAPAYSRNFSVSVVLPASGWLMIANVRRRAASASTSGGRRRRQSRSSRRYRRCVRRPRRATP